MRDPQRPAEVHLVVFQVGEQDFGLDVGQVREVVRYRSSMPVPRTPAFVEGVLDLRGTLIPVVDLRRRFEVPAAGASRSTRVLVVRHHDDWLGLVVDAVLNVVRVDPGQLAEPPAYVRGIAAEYFRGVVRVEGRLVALLDVERVLSADERIALQNFDVEAAGAVAQPEDPRPGADGLPG